VHDRADRQGVEDRPEPDRATEQEASEEHGELD
jgi:hypothetical protein